MVVDQAGEWRLPEVVPLSRNAAQACAVYRFCEGEYDVHAIALYADRIGAVEDFELLCELVRERVLIALEERE